MLGGKKVLKPVLVLTYHNLRTTCAHKETNFDEWRSTDFLIATALTEDDKLEVEQDMTVLQTFAEMKCINAQPPLDYSIQVSILPYVCV